MFGPNEVDIEQVKMRDDSLNSYLLNTPHEDITSLPEQAAFVLAHSGGDVIVWSDLDTKIKDEWDG